MLVYIWLGSTFQRVRSDFNALKILKINFKKILAIQDDQVKDIILLSYKGVIHR